MRTCGGNDPPGVPVFPHSAGSAASKASSQPLGFALQPWSSSYEPRTGDTGSIYSFPAPLRGSTPASAGPPSASQSRPGTAPRVLVGKDRCMSADVVIAHHRCFMRTDSATTLPYPPGLMRRTIRDDQMKQKDQEIAHLGNRTRVRQSSDFTYNLAIRQGQAI